MNTPIVIGQTEVCGLPCIIVEMNGEKYAGVAGTVEEATRLALMSAAEDIVTEGVA